MKNVKFLVLISLIIVSCDPPLEYLRLSDENTSFLKKNNIICYKDSASSMIDTFLIRREEGWSADHELRQQYLIVYYAKKTEPDTVYFKYTIGNGRMSTWLMTSYSLYYNKNFIDVVIWGSTSFNLKIDSIMYQGVNSMSVKTILPDEPKKLYGTFNYGIIRYELNDGRVYNLVRK
jgi:hypothetical protein